MTNGKAWIPILITIFAQTIGVVWWASSLASKVDELAAETERQRVIIIENANRLTQVQTIQQELIKIVKPYDQEFYNPGRK